MNKLQISFLLLFLASLAVTLQLNAQKSGLKKIDKPDLESHITILAADDMEGRATGERGLDKAAKYLAEQASEAGLKAIDTNRDYYQNYTLVRKEMDTEKSTITVSHNNIPGSPMNLPYYVMNADTNKMELSGEVVFGGYGIISAEDDYNDLEGIDIAGKILLIMNRGPLSETGEENLLFNRNWKYFRSFQYKMPALSLKRPKAVLIVLDPKSGYKSMEEISSRMARYWNSSRYVRELSTEQTTKGEETDTKYIFIHREVAEEILKSSGNTLMDLQNSIDSVPKPNSFEVPDTKITISANYIINERPIPNVVGIIEGSDPELKKEVIVYSAHFDHLGTNNKGEVYNGADDNASGTAALIELAEAFKAEQTNLKRSVMILWVSGEEIGLYGSKYYTKYPLMPLENTVANINLDMIGRVRTERDKGKTFGEYVSIHGMDTIGLIGGHQSSDLMEIHERVTKKVGLSTDTSLNNPDHPYRYYYRSDHFNFAKNDIPVLFYSTGIHLDYHRVTDDTERIDYKKLKKVCELSFLVGYKLATMPERVRVDNPYSGW